MLTPGRTVEEDSDVEEIARHLQVALDRIAALEVEVRELRLDLSQLPN